MLCNRADDDMKIGIVFDESVSFANVFLVTVVSMCVVANML